MGFSGKYSFSVNRPLFELSLVPSEKYRLQVAFLFKLEHYCVQNQRDVRTVALVSK